MTDISLDEHFDVELDNLGDIETVDDIDEAEQHIRYAITDYFFEHIGDRNSSNLPQKLKIKANRVVDDLEIIDSLEEIDVIAQEGETIRMYIRFNYDEEIEFEVI